MIRRLKCSPTSFFNMTTSGAHPYDQFTATGVAPVISTQNYTDEVCTAHIGWQSGAKVSLLEPQPRLRSPISQAHFDSGRKALSGKPNSLQLVTTENDVDP